ncbi:hypothetical protein HWI79_2090 [Cryptosporidium felis]|nr:hypothetical protein HWI79_2090 [Cryptosporidium felis]
MNSEGEESWYSVQEPETLGDLFRKRIIEYDPTLGLNLSRELRSSSWELIDTLTLPLPFKRYQKGQNINLDVPYSKIKKIRRLVVNSSFAEDIRESLNEFQSSNSSTHIIGELEIAGKGTCYLGSEDSEDDEGMLRELIISLKSSNNFEFSVKRLRLRNLDVTISGFLEILLLEFPDIEVLELENCELEGLKRGRALDSRKEVSIFTIRTYKCIKTSPTIMGFFPCLKEMIYEPNTPLSEIYDFFPKKRNCVEKGLASLEVFELRIPSKISDMEFLNGFFIESFPEMENLRHFRILSSNNKDLENKFKERNFNLKQAIKFNLEYLREGIFPKIESLELRNLYISLETFEHISSMFSITRKNSGYGWSSGDDPEEHQDFKKKSRKAIKKLQQIKADFELKFEKGISGNESYNISKYSNLSIQEESEFLLNSDFNKFGFKPSENTDEKPSHSLGENKFSFGVPGGPFGSSDKSIEKAFPCEGLAKTRMRSQRDSEVLQPFLKINNWRIFISETSRDSLKVRRQWLLREFRSGVMILDHQLDEMQSQSLPEVYLSLLSRTVLDYLVDPLKTVLQVTSSKIYLSLGFDNLIYSGYMLGILLESQETVEEFSALSCLIPLEFLVRLEFKRIRILGISLFKDRNLEPGDLIKLCSWLERFGSNLEYLHVRVTGSTSRWVPNEREIIRLRKLWGKLSPKAGKNDKIKFECCYTDQIFSKIASLTKDLECDTESE